MHPVEIMELMFVGGTIAVIIIVSLFLKGKWRKFCLLLALAASIAFGLFYILRPYWIDTQINKKVEMLNVYLTEHYPTEEWEISTVPHREDGNKHLNPYYISVTFNNEPDVLYEYWVENESSIFQRGYSTNKNLDMLEHMENELE
ncbi:hypothetical protein [Psychrobacillus soli]|uniref:DUF3139 domain-containing protein n=1 Tax=Psychrobacillus soli TaxID=1543965 RepID=A0A544TKH6_9BACI|nr:hypothetical protein [Psychrobacillus soli]TQR17940.1 hypothetical protein FG383_03555 [Psychrobacillus soli]